VKKNKKKKIRWGITREVIFGGIGMGGWNQKRKRGDAIQGLKNGDNMEEPLQKVNPLEKREGGGDSGCVLLQRIRAKFPEKTRAAENVKQMWGEG